MTDKDDRDGLHSLDDLLGAEENIYKWRADLFETVSPVEQCTLLSSEYVDMEDLQKKSNIILPDKTTESIYAKEASKSICFVKAREYALKAHHGQLRRYTTEPYWKHLAEVAGLVASSSSASPRGIVLAWLHATVEDTVLTLRDIERDFGASIADGVRCLTRSANDRISRAARKQRYRNRLASGDKDVHTVKLANIASNLASIGYFDPGFALDCYLEEKRLEAGVLVKGDEGLKVLVRRLWLEAKNTAAAKLEQTGNPAAGGSYQ